MKEHGKSIVVLIALYLCVSIAGGSFYPFDWTDVTRKVYAIASFAIVIIPIWWSWMRIEVEGEDYDDE